MKKLSVFLLTGIMASTFALDFGGEVDVGWTKVKGKGVAVSNLGARAFDSKTDGILIEFTGTVRHNSLIGKVKAGHYSGDGDYTLIGTEGFDQKSYWAEAIGGYNLQFAGFEVVPYVGLGYWKIKSEWETGGDKKETIKYAKIGAEGSRQIAFLKGYVDLALLKTVDGEYKSGSYNADLDKSFHYQVETGIQWKFLKLGVFYKKWDVDIEGDAYDRSYRLYGIKTGIVF